MTLIYELALDILKMYLRIANKLSRSSLANVRARTGQTHRHTRTEKDRHTQTDKTERLSTAAFVSA